MTPTHAAPSVHDPFIGVPLVGDPRGLMTAAVVVVGLAALVYAWLKLRVPKIASSETAGMNYVVGPMGSGKSMYGVKIILEAVTAGKYAITNVRLLPGWEEKVRRKLYPRDRSPERAARREAWLRGFYIFETSLVQATRYRLPCAYCGAPHGASSAGSSPTSDPGTCSHAGPANEGRAVFVWDETHNDLNNRDYSGVGETREERSADRRYKRTILRYATQLRKLGFCGYLLSQHSENTDKQLQRACNNLVRLQNQRHKGLGRILPRRFTMFLVYWYPAHLADGTTRVPPTRFERYLLPWHRVLYNSWETFHGLDEGADDETAPIQLPAGGRPQLAAVGPPPQAGRTAAAPDTDQRERVTTAKARLEPGLREVHDSNQASRVDTA